MLSDNSFSETHLSQNTFVDLVEQSQLNLNHELSLSSGNELEYFNQNYLEPSVLEYAINPLQANEKETDVLTGLNLLEPSVVGQPDIRVSELTLSSSIRAGNTVSINYTLQNIGDAPASSSHTKYYLSSDTTFDSSDLELGNNYPTSISDGASQSISDSVTFNGNLSIGSYYFLVVADSTNTNLESDETNNIFSQALKITKPDLVVESSSITVPSSLVAGQVVKFNYAVKNQGNASAVSSITKYYVSTDMNLDSSDIYLGNDTVANIGFGASITRSDSITLNNKLNSGTYYFLTQVDANNTCIESNEANNIFAETIELQGAPDLDIILNTSNIASSVAAGSVISVPYTIENIGQSTAPASSTRFYLSTNPTYESTDILIGSDNVVAMPVGVSISEVKTFTIDFSVPTGSYYLLAKADAANTVKESNGANNIFSSPETIEITNPDLEITQFTLLAPTEPSVGSSVEVSYTIVNKGQAAAQASITQYYLSSDELFDAGDNYLGDDSISALESGATLNRTSSFVLNTSLENEKYYLIAIADSKNVVKESNESNNLNSQTIQITEPGVPDLIINPLSIAVSGLNLSVSYTLKNQGTLESAVSNTKFYLSSNNVLEATDTLLGTDAVAALSRQNSSVESVALKLANNLNAGTYYILAQADSDNAIAESNETNNITNTTIQIASDLIISNLSVSSGSNKVTQGYGFTPTYTLKNQGNASSGTSVIKYVVSKDAILGNADDFLPTLLANGGADAGLAAGASRIESNDYLVIYDNLTPGLYNLYAIADSTNTVTESNETNNIYRTQIDFSIPPKPDLIVDKLILPSSANIGSHLNLSYTIRNIDLGYLGSSYLSFYLSADNVIDGSDLNLGYHMVSSNTPYNVPISRSRSVFLDPLKISTGTYNLIAKVDPNNSVSESNETNNILINSITINPLLLSDLSITNVSLTSYFTDSTSGNPVPSTDILRSGTRSASVSSLNTGSLITLPYTISNTGGAIGKSQTNFYLSTDPVYNSTDTYLGSHSVLALDMESSREVSASIYLNPSAIALGTNTYYLIAQADAGSPTTTESNEANNFTAIPVIINNSGTTNFTNNKGYGFINAAAAVAASVGVAPFADVPNVNTNWGVNLTLTPEVWNAGFTGQGITVAVIDTGVDYNHPDLINNIWVNADEIAGNGVDDDQNGFIDDVKGWNFVESNNTPMDTDGHGTHVAGIVGASRNSIGQTGVAYNSKIMPLKVLGGGDEWTNVSNAIRYAVDNGARVINMSLGGSTSDLDGRLKESLQYAAEHGVIVVSAAGNYSESAPIIPASYATQWGLAVGAATNTGATASYSNKAGTQASMAYVTAPGSSTSTLPNNKYGNLSGTSMAAPHVAGVVALMLSANPNLTDAEVRQILTQTAIAGTI